MLEALGLVGRSQKVASQKVASVGEDFLEEETEIACLCCASAWLSSPMASPQCIPWQHFFLRGLFVSTLWEYLAVTLD